ncbi:MAG: two-component sensor histidine kinase [Sphingomonas sp.]|nr:MAG: two-component sensor histidine kinase [Sphingomonas sp.]
MAARSIAVHLTMAFAATAAAVCTVTGFSIYMFQVNELHRHQRAELLARQAIVLPLVERAGTPRYWELLSDKLESFSPADGAVRFRVIGPDPRFGFGEPWPDGARVQHNSDRSYFVRFGDKTFLAVESLAPARDERPASRLVIASDYGPILASRRMLGAWILLVSILGVAATAGLAWLIARRGLQPLRRLTRSASSLNPNDLGLRLPARDLPTELEGMTLAFNSALERIQAAYARLSGFNADVAHELRTPLGNLIGQTEVALSRPRGAAELEEVLHSNLEELERLAAIVNDMLFLARADAGTMTRQRMACSLAELARGSADFLEYLFDEQDVRLHILGDATARVEPALLRRALTNLLENAVRHGRARSEVRVRIERRGDLAFISVANPGQAISPEQLDRLFDRFYRVDPARADSLRTHGLGLAIVKAIATMHGGSVFARYEQDHFVIGLSVADAAGAEPVHQPAEPARPLFRPSLPLQGRAAVPE